MNGIGAARPPGAGLSGSSEADVTGNHGEQPHRDSNRPQESFTVRYKGTTHVGSRATSC